MKNMCDATGQRTPGPGPGVDSHILNTRAYRCGPESQAEFGREGLGVKTP